jgi:hypothetical protein
MLPELILQRFHARHGDKYTYPHNLSDYKKNTDKIPILCHVKGHGIFYQSIENHMRGQECPKCQYQKRSLNNMIGRIKWIERFEQVHGKGRYSYSKLPNNIKANEEFPIICTLHNMVFCQTPNTHWKLRQGCPKCGKIRMWENIHNKVVTRSEFIERAQLKNGFGYEYINLPKEFSLNDTIGIFCTAHSRLFFCTGQEHLEGMGCLECKSEKSLD